MAIIRVWEPGFDHSVIVAVLASDRSAQSFPRS